MSLTLDEWLLRIGEIHPVGWDLGLDRVSVVGARLGLLHPADQVVLVAGTNGKGSTVAYLSAIAQMAGLNVGQSTSPHLHKFNERIVINGRPVDDTMIVEAFESIDEARGEVTLTYFEFASLASMLIFKQQELDLAILEVGLGGRLDAMNIVDPDLSIITSIDMDHEAWLGNTREEIAREKAGIMRKGVTCLIADEDPPASLFEEAGRIGALAARVSDRSVDGLQTSLPSISLALASEAARQLELNVDEEMRSAVARETRLTGRRSWATGPCPVLLDVAHNPAAACSLAAYVRSLRVPGAVHALYGAYGDKDIERVTAAFSDLIQTWHLTGLRDDRAALAHELEQRLSIDAHGVTETYDNIGDAIRAIDVLAGKDDLILVFGSFPVVAGALEHYALASDQEPWTNSGIR